MVLKKVVKFLFVAFLFQSHVWAMGPPTEEENKAIALCPSDILYFIYLENLETLPPISWVNAALVCRDWNKAFNHTNFWKPLGGWQYLESNPKTNNQALTILEDLFQGYPPLKTLSQFINSIPTAESLKNFFVYGYLKTRGKTQEANGHLISAYAQGHPKAAWKLSKQYCKAAWEQEQSRDAKARKFLSIPFDKSNWPVYPGNKSWLFSNDLLFQAALGGVLKARGPLIETAMIQLYPLEDIRHMGPEQDKIFISLLNKFIDLGQIWPEARGSILKLARPSQFQKIAEGKPAALSFKDHKVSMNVKWPEAFLILGKMSFKPFNPFANSPYLTLQELQKEYNNNQEAISFYQKAYDAKATNAPYFYIKSFPPLEKHMPILQEIRQSDPSALGIVLSKIGQIMMHSLPENAEITHPRAQAFMSFCKDAHRELIMTNYSPSRTKSLDCKSRAHYCRNMDVKKASHLMTQLSSDLDLKREKFLSVSVTFLDWAMTTPQYAPSNVFRGIMLNYLNDRWGNNFTSNGLLPTGANINGWNKRDTNYTLEYFDLASKNGFEKENFREQYKNFMVISLKAKEEVLFVICFKNYCRWTSNFAVGDVHCKYLTKELNAFLKQNPHNAELPLFFGKFLYNQTTWTKPTIEEKWKPTAIEHFQTAAQNGSQEAVEFLQTEANKGSRKAQDFLVYLTFQKNNELGLTEEPARNKRKAASQKAAPPKRQKKMDPDEMDDQ